MTKLKKFLGVGALIGIGYFIHKALETPVDDFNKKIHLDWKPDTDAVDTKFATFIGNVAATAEYDGWTFHLGSVVDSNPESFFGNEDSTEPVILGQKGWFWAASRHDFYDEDNIDDLDDDDFGVDYTEYSGTTDTLAEAQEDAEREAYRLIYGDQGLVAIHADH